MASSPSATRIVTLSDWANAGVQQNLVLVRPDGEDSIVKRIREHRATDNDRRYLDRVEQPRPQAATVSEVRRLHDLLESRYGKSLRKPKRRQTAATRAVAEIAAHTHRDSDQIWKMKISDVANVLEGTPMPGAADDDSMRAIECVHTERVSDANTDAENCQPAEPVQDQRLTTRREIRSRWLAEAMLLVRDHPGWSDAEIARQVHKHPSRLTRSPEYKMAASLARGSKNDLPKGFVVVDLNTGKRDSIEAMAPDAPLGDDKSDRGSPIPGSKYFREFCEECGEAMKVQAGVVGKKPVCKDCKT